ncbi:MAG TPA: ATP-binding protein [Verrucomicrobiae bacterium]|nr:ATP-binding protein [Verrucomicrobiae bacterium]
MFDQLSLNILDIGMNSLAAGANAIQIAVIESVRRDWLIIRIRDNGRGMNSATLKRVLGRNFTTKTGRKKPIGLGLALLRQSSEMCGGTFHIRSAPSEGTSITASMRLSHVDRPPLGDLNGTILALCASNKTVDVRLHYRSDEGTFQFSSKEHRSDISRPENIRSGGNPTPARLSGPTA